jgi:CheY-like chemotaxis protein
MRAVIPNFKGQKCAAASRGPCQHGEASPPPWLGYRASTARNTKVSGARADFFPVSQMVSQAPAAESPASPGATTVLVVDDEPSVRQLVCRLLQIRGYRVLEAANGADALLVWQETGGKIDLLLTDVVMPRQMSGRALAERLKAERPDLRVLYTSGYNMELGDEAGQLPPGTHFVQKPYRIEELLQAVRAALADDVQKDSYVETPSRR